MSLTSANIDDLTGFTDSSDGAVGRLGSSLTTARNKANAVTAACSFQHPSTPSLDALATLRDDWTTNASFVRTVRDELKEADSYDASGNPVISSRSVEQALADAGLTDPPGVVTVADFEVFGEPPYSGFVDDPICLANGNFILVEDDLPMYGTAEVLTVRRTYNSRDHRSGSFGTRWSSVLDISLQITERRITHRHADGGGFVFHRRADGDWTIDTRRRRSLRAVADGWEIDEAHERTWSFDAEGRLTGLIDGPSRVRIERGDDAIVLHEAVSGRWVRYDLAADTGLVTTVTSSDGRRVDYRHDDDEHLLGAERDIGDLTYEIDAEGFLEAAIDADGVTVFRNTYDPDGWVLSQIEQHGRETRYEYRDDGVSTVTATDGAPPNVMVHDRRGRMTAMIDGLGNTMRVTYDERDDITQLVDRSGAVTRYRHDDRGNVVERIDPDGLTQRFEWDELDRLVTEIDRAGVAVTHEYEGDQREPSRTLLPDGSSVVSRFDEHGLLLSITDADGVTASVERDEHGAVTAVRTGDDLLLRIGYDAAGRAVEAETGGVVATADLDAAGRLLRIAGPDGERRFDHSPAGRWTGSIDPAGAHWRFERDGTGEVTRIFDELGTLLRYERDGVGQVTAVVDAEGGRIDYELDPLGRPVAVRDGNRNATTYRYDPEGRVIEVVDANGNRFVQERDRLGRVVTEIEPSGARRQLTYHPNGEVATQTDEAGNTWRNEVDALGRVIAVTDPLGAVTSMRYTPTGKLLELRSPTGRLVRNVYDEAGRHVSTTGPDGDTLVVADLDVDQLRGGSVTFREGLPESATAAGATSRFRHDPRGLLQQAIDPAGVLTEFLRDGCGRLVETATGSVGMSYEWDAAGHLRSVIDPNGNRTDIRRGALGEMTRIHHPDGSALTFDWDLDGYLHRIADPNGGARIDITRDVRGLVTRADDGASTITAENDARGDLVSLSTTLGAVRFGRDADGALVGISDERHRITIHRDEAGPITAFQLDDQPPVAAPGPATVVRDEANRIVLDEEGRAFGYDLAGRLASTTVGDRTITYEYDDRGLLATEHAPEGVRVHHHGAAGEILRLRETDGSETVYLYDLLGRRIAEQHDDGSQRDYSWDPFGRLVTITDIDVDGGRRSRSIERDPLGRPLTVDGEHILWADAMGLELHGIGDERFVRTGTRVRVLTDPDGSWSRRVGDDPWGDDGGTGVRIGHRGHLAVDELVLMGHRVYDPVSRSFLSRDPLPSLPGQVSYAGLYQYAWCDPVNHLDPTGRRPLTDEDYANWQQHNTQGWLRKNWKSIAVAAGAVVIGGLITVATGGAAGPLVMVAIGAGLGAASGGVDAWVNGGDGGDILRGALLGGVFGAATAGAGAGVSHLVSRGAQSVAVGATQQGSRLLTGTGRSLAINAAVEFPMGAISEGVNYGIARASGDRYAQYDVGMVLLTSSMSVAGGTGADRIVAARTPPDSPDIASTPTDPEGPGPASPGRTLTDLRSVDGIGDTLARRVLATRNAFGGEPLTYQQLLNIDQIGPVRAQAIMDAGMN